MKHPKVSVIIPVYNGADHIIGRAIRSVLGQTFQDYELIVAEGFSTDNTVELVKEIKDPRLRLINYPLKLRGEKVNAAIADARGKYIVLVDDDNELFSDFLRATVEILDTHPEYDAVTTGRIIEYPGFQDYAPAFKGPGFTSIDWGWLIRKEVWENIKYDIELVADDDADWGIEFFKVFKYKAYPIDIPLQVAYTDDEGSVCAPSKKRLESLMKFYQKDAWAYAEDPKELAFLERFVGRTLFKGGEHLKAIPFFFRAFLAKPSRRTATHFLFSLGPYKLYEFLMDVEERYYSSLRRKQYGI